MRSTRVQRQQGLLAALLFALASCAGDEPTAASNLAADYRPNTLLEAVLLGDPAAVDRFLSAGANVNAAEIDGTTPLMRAIHGHFPEIAQRLIDAGANVAATNNYGVSPLYLAARAGDVASTRALIRAGANANTALPEGETVLMTAAKVGNPDIVRVLLTGGDESMSLAAVRSAATAPEPTVSSGYAASESGVTVGANRPANRANVNAREGWYGQTALMWAAAEGHAEVVRMLIEAGASVNVHSARVDTPEPNPNRVAAAFADPSMPTGYLTALHFAAREGHVEAVRALIEGGANVNELDEEGSNALGYAATNNQPEIARLLLAAGADINLTGRRAEATAELLRQLAQP